MSKNILVKFNGVDVTEFLVDSERVVTFGDEIARYWFKFTKNVNGAVAITNALTVEVWLDSSIPPTTKVFDGFIDLFKPERGIIEITAKDQLALLINKQIMKEYDSSVPGDASFPDGKISNIFADIVVTYGGLTTISSAFVGTLTTQDSGTESVLTKFICRNADPFERCKKLADTLDWAFYYKASDDKVYFEPKNQTTNSNILTVGDNIVVIPEWEYDRSEMINDLRLEGAQQLVSGSEVFQGDGNETVFTISNIPEDMIVYYNNNKNYANTAPVQSEIKIGDIPNAISTHDYEVDKKNKTFTFTSFTPATGTSIATLSDIITQYSYYAPIPIHMEDSVSKATYGTYAKTIPLTDVITLDDAWKRAENIIAKYGVPFKSAKLKVQWTNDLNVSIGQTIRVIDNLNEPNIDQFFTIYRITDNYPEATVDLEVGDRQFTIEEYQANIIERVKRLEETVIGTTDATTEIVQNKIEFDFVPEETTVRVEFINDSFILGHPDNSILSTTPLGNRTTLSQTVTYTW